MSKLRLLADENLPLPSIQALRSAGHDVVSVAEEAAGTRDREILARAVSERRVLITFDRDFGELVFRSGESAYPGVILLRFRPSGPTDPADFLLALFAQAEIRLEGFFTVLDRDRVRQRPLPG